ncbi:hypothetical protein RFI36_02300 [Acinetobacter gerneri]|uniref:Uncharacterized protein n=1 Tax=Acinetobacter gerneri TaxID=202952 RepID=A0AAW8JFK0_9GAMM|nr:DUF6670 family protein [Acinetobacter gerneri]MDQ9008354.1 hypothetical protein [Acinetobacter gerneri]MDQ9012681.1 hypothetical protein [Acinetobacter gerneri]MDQ9024116.1 hypothetical protein [Acinetobacter gerneri]MDQ9050922.1 hypothetical protein [Acinetobacter gerneri]MDQ9058576.1 hypothetical protein [Acinetobacter gerneri]
MQLLMSTERQTQPRNQARFPLSLDYHAPKGRFRIIHQGLKIPNLPAPLHYFNFVSIIGQPRIPMLRNEYAIQTTALDTVSIISSSSPHMVGHFHSYSIENDCKFEQGEFQFSDRESLIGDLPDFYFVRNDPELSAEIKINTLPIVSHFTKIRFGLFDHWSMPCHCTGNIIYKGQHFTIDQLGCFDFARIVNMPYLPWCFYSYQVINLQKDRQIVFLHIRNHFNQIVQSKIYLRDIEQQSSQLFEDNVQFKIHRVYPKVTTPNHQDMYLAREFEWSYQNEKSTIHLYGQSRGDFKFGLAAGYVGSFNYQIKINEEIEEGSSGYCEYIDCRPLKWQEKNFKEKILDGLAHPEPFLLKK